MKQKSFFIYGLECYTKHFADFKGRARRRELWSFFVVQVLLNMSMVLIDQYVLVPTVRSSTDEELIRYIMMGMYSLSLVPLFAVISRRLHDVGKPFVYIIIPSIPIIGPLLLIYLIGFKDSVADNQYGRNPKSELAIWEDELLR